MGKGDDNNDDDDDDEKALRNSKGSKGRGKAKGKVNPFAALMGGDSD